MDLNALYIFTQVVQAGSLSKAGERLAMPVATVSRQILALEKQLNIQLFDRAQTGVKPTALGQQLYQQVHLNMDNLLNALRLLLNHQQELKGILRISTTTDFEPIWTKIAEFQRQFPHIQIYCDTSKRIVDLVEDNIDIACRVGNVQAEDVIAKPIGTLSMRLVATPTLIAQYSEPQNVADLAKLPCADWANRDDLSLIWHFGNESVRLSAQLATNDMTMLTHYAQQGLAVCYLPDYLAERLIREHGLIELLPNAQKPRNPSISCTPHIVIRLALSERFWIFVSYRNENAI